MLLDTNILIGYINGDQAIRNVIRMWREVQMPLTISSITVGELLSYQELTDAEILDLELFAATFISVPFDDQLAKAAAELKRNYRFDITDAGILATAKIRRLQVVSRDVQLHKAKEIGFVKI